MAGSSLGGDLFKAILQGTPPGAVYALVALGFVLTYKTSGVFNFAFGAQAYVSAAMYFKARLDWGWPTVPAVVVSVFVLAPALGLLLERLIFRPLRTAPAVAKLVVAVGLAVAIPNLFDILFGFSPRSGATPVGVVPDGAGVFYDPFGSYAFSRNELVDMGVALAALVALGTLFRWGDLGLRMRAVVESPRMTELNGIAADRISAFAWALSSLFAGVAGVLIAPRFNTLAAGDFFSLMVVAIAAAAVGRLVSLPRTVAGAFILGIGIALLNTFLPRWADDHAWLKTVQDNLTPSVPFVVLFAVVVLVPSIARARESTDPLAGVEPPPPSVHGRVRDPRATLVTRLVAAVLLLVVAVVVLTVGNQLWVYLVTQAVAMSVIFLSITVITGMAGQISLCQGAFAAIGAFTVYQLVAHYNMPVLVASLVGAAVAAAVAAVLALPIRRLGGIWVAIATMAFAYAFDAVGVKLSWIGGGDAAIMTGTAVPRPLIGTWDLANDKSYLVFAALVLVVVALAVTALRAGTFGRTLAALRGSELAAGAIGISAPRARLVAFAVSAFIAGLGGALLAMSQESVNYDTNFSPFAAMFWLVIVVTLGARTVPGALNAAVAFSLFDQLILKGDLFGWIIGGSDKLPGLFPITGKWVFVLFGLAAVQFARHPEGLVERGYARPSFADRLFPRLRGAPADDLPPSPRPAVPGVANQDAADGTRDGTANRSAGATTAVGAPTGPAAASAREEDPVR
ncbi:MULTISPECIES: ABC transporter permease [Pseudofrankia]|uniref:ABC transporter permease n=1 Tax=Pseudofrankia TaxID=2994363 RepID=UPI000234BE85|nr:MULTISPECIES: ABC transporter permease [Pseudofrankia]